MLVNMLYFSDIDNSSETSGIKKNMLNKTLVLLVFLFFAVFLHAQDDPDERIHELVEFDIVEAGSEFYGNLSQINQIGQNNEIVAIQESSENALNAIVSEQRQFNNSGYIKQIGSFHTTLLFQNGSDNKTDLWMIGSLTATEVIQHGNHNKLNAFINNQGILPKVALLNQYGDNNTIELAILGNNNVCLREMPSILSVNQFGNTNNVELILEKSFEQGVTVTQTGGAALTIKQSDFYFPMK
jgi:hypothetical protein